MSALSLKRIQVTLEDKYDAIMSYVKKEKTAKQIIIELKIGQSTLSGWLKIKDEIINQYENSGNGKIKKNKKAAHCEVEKALVEWFHEVRKENISINGPILMEKANSHLF